MAFMIHLHRCGCRLRPILCFSEYRNRTNSSPFPYQILPTTHSVDRNTLSPLLIESRHSWMHSLRSTSSPSSSSSSFVSSTFSRSIPSVPDVLFSDSDLDDWVRARSPMYWPQFWFESSEPRVLNSIERTDWWRYMVIEDSDTDVIALKPFDEGLFEVSSSSLSGDMIVTIEGVMKSNSDRYWSVFARDVQVQQFLFAAKPHLPILKWVIEKVGKNFEWKSQAAETRRESREGARNCSEGEKGTEISDEEPLPDASGQWIRGSLSSCSDLSCSWMPLNPYIRSSRFHHQFSTLDRSGPGVFVDGIECYLNQHNRSLVQLKNGGQVADVMILTTEQGKHLFQHASSGSWK